ncbi:polyprenyl synthetase family protein [Urechidicola vernalis]|uniref:Polyprenyl synthetase family protein n=1 Tax=Urechidicola vernalis TaxID=3075600 RepID=A0ABU2Y5U0_9FLAO|nr:polyprenyl synthetase family protein [Urechidicola sp. P050]MDT0553166.1 polyprenyl synthetase family protein [Urechidicola sp. P050]
MIAELKLDFLQFLETKIKSKEPKNLYDPITYILGLGGKKIRPLLTLMIADAFGEDYIKAMDAALAVEVFHNFTLIHDDIMDDAPLRRGNVTVHEKWDVNTGILSGDAVMIMAYQCFDKYESKTFKKLIQLFSKTALEVCEGQQLDVDFETRNDVTIEEYIKMISLKTSVLIACAMEFGAIIANADGENARKVYEFGLNLGIAFQLQDDYLDTFGNPETFGKQVGGDIIENKKTFLYLTALINAKNSDKVILKELYCTKLEENFNKIKQVKHIFESSGASEATLEEIKKYTNLAFENLKAIDIASEKKEFLKQFGQNLMQRNA